ncbi:glucosaminidase domain-containing protein [Flavobacterium cheniae]|uniref:Peptidoglycan hydrolase n=1 Tax=Flavobacterium cheniae TaxID=295428 RepID=A0A562KDG5_9FLAO|nr:glucosaminidase domain-containing protein [Flavobacterium cheniae]TDR19726.1 flagellum-specific peptidoglycan hydrolase FlgJ [Flavobacterium cheniae]TWH93468.1 flagellum-specific peptidoglycan hydrolase FlgJ [Flavobacterium cheniae]
MKIKFALFILALFVVSCTSTKPVVRTTTKPKVTTKSKPVTQTKTTTKTTTKPVVVTSPTKSETTDSKPKTDSEVSLVATSNVKTYAEEIQIYVDNFKEIAQNNMRAHGIPASITLAQGILESGAGKGKLALSANNHFGIKCHKEWNGESVKHDDDAAQECFRKYEHPSESYRDHSLFLTSRPRYSNLFKLDKGDYESWAKGLKSAGYATDVKYPDKLIGLIERFELYKYDNEVLSRDFKPSKKEVILAQGGDYYTIQQGDTLYSLSKKFNLKVDDLKKLNNMSDNAISIGQQIKIK